MKEVEFMDRDFLDNKIEIGDKVIFETPQYRDFTIGTVITKAPKSCQIEYLNTSGLCKGYIGIIRQGYGQIIKYPIVKEGKWVPKDVMIRSIDALNYTCSECGSEGGCTPYCAYCGANMMEDEE